MQQTQIKKEKKTKVFQGRVLSDKMEKTIVVRVDRLKEHPKYKKRYLVSKKFKVDDEKKEAKIGDQVSFVECRPLSKDKKWKLLKVIKKAEIILAEPEEVKEDNLEII